MKKRTLGFIHIAAQSALLSVMVPAWAKAQDVQVVRQDAVLEEVTITGTHIKSSVDNLPSPITVLGTDALANTGRTNMAEMLALLPIQAGSLQFSDNLQNNFTSGVNLNLRGIGPASTLVLINGRRQTVTAIATDDGDTFVDINSLVPSILIERIELVKDGASALYGSDAVAGIANFITRDAFEGLDFSVRYQSTDKNENNEDLTVSAIVGGGNDRSHFVLAASYLHRTEFPVRNIPEYVENGFRSAIGQPGSFVLQPGQDYLPPYNALNPGTTVSDPLCGNPALGAPPLPGIVVGPAAGGPGLCRMPLAYALAVVPDEERVNAYAIGHYDLADSVRLFTEMGLTRDRVHRMSSPSFGDGRLRLVPAENPGNPFGGDVLFLGRPLGLRHGATYQDIESDTLRGVVGLRGDLARDWTWEVSATYSSNESRFQWYDTLRDRFEAALIGEGGINNNQYFNPFGNEYLAQPGDPRYNEQSVVDDFFVPAVLEADSSLRVFDMVVSGDLMEMPAGALGLAVGAQFRKDSTSGDWNNDMNSGRFMLIPQSFDWSGSRDVEAVFAELAIPVLESVDIQLAGRYEDYGNGVNTVDPKIGALWRATDSLTVRATAGSSFRGPGVFQVFGSAVSNETLFTNTGTYSVTVVTTGSTELEPETSDNITAEIVWDATDNLRLSLAYWSFDLSDLIVRASPQNLINTTPCDGVTVICNSLGQPIQVVVQYQNAAFLKTDGFDFDVQYALSSNFGDFTFGVDANLVTSYDLRESNTQPVIDGLGSRNFANFGAPMPEWRGRGTVDWNLGAHSAGIAVNYIGEVENDVPVAGRSSKIDAFTTFDLRYAYAFEDLFGGPLTLAIGATNITDELAPIVYGATAAFDPELHDPRGRSMYVELSKSFQ